MTTTTDTLTISSLLDLAEIAEAAIQTKRVRYLLGEGGDVIAGTVRSIGDENGNFLGLNEDVRNGFLRITLDSGFEVFLPMAEAAEMVRRYRMVFGDFS